ncbi:septation protein A [Psychromonas sp. RZ22]|uniref:septation protein A n=1 Tax=Psychromonas algarum TaxID=2555643 RepID=UPI0010675499|nr:septation protein A [Psychromonas sp. RZ22]TEW54398.1 septation protein A [Psychromonas sp. RZ22]
MKQFFEFIPLIIFFIVYKMIDIYVATGSLIVTTGLLLAYNYLKHGKAEKMHIITFLMVLIFGTLTLVLHDDVFIKWKVTVIYALFSIALIVSQYAFHKPFIKQMLGKEISLPDNVWNRLNLAWAIFFMFLGLLNIYVAFSLTQDIWVDFKVFGLLGATLVFTVLSGLYIYKYLPNEDQKQLEKPEQKSK